MKLKIRKNRTISRLRFRWIFLFITILTSIFLIQGCSKSDQQIKIDTEYKAIFLDNGQAFFGRIEEVGSSYILLKDVFYVQSQVIQEKDKREVKSVLIKRGNEWHGPDLMYINVSHVVVIEPVSPNSRVAQLIKEAKNQKP
jgi:hypothetical protein